MKIGVELGWRAVRVITVGAQNEILSVNDAAQPSVVLTPPIVAVSSGGALVGQAAIDLIQDEQQAGNLITTGHALTGLGDAFHSPDLLAILLEKIGRDIEGFGSTRSDVTFIVSEDIIPPDNAGDIARGQLAKAAAWANFKTPTLSYRVEAAAREGLDTYTSAEINSLTIPTHPVVRTLVIDAGTLSLSAYSLGVMLKQIGNVVPTPSKESWGNRPAGVPDGATDGEAGEEHDIALAFDMFRHFALTVEAQTGAKFSAPVMDSIWELVRDPHAPPFHPVIDRTGKSRLFDVNGCRRELADAVRQSLPRLLAGFAALSDHSFIFIGGQYAAIAEVSKAIREVCNKELGKPLHFRELPAHGVAGAVRFEDLSPVPLIVPTQPDVALGDVQEKQPKHLRAAPESVHNLQAKPINDGQWPAATDDQAVGNKSSEVPPPGLLSGVVSPVTFNIALGVDSASQQVGAFWAQKVDTLLRLLLTAPTVGLKERYEQYFEQACVAGTVRRDGLNNRTSLWARLFDRQNQKAALANLLSRWNGRFRRQFADQPASDLRGTYLDPVLDRLVDELLNLAGDGVFVRDVARTKVILGFENATGFADADHLSISEHFEPYVSAQRNGVITTPLTLFNGFGSSTAKRPAGISVPGRVILTEAGLARTHLSWRPRYHTLGYAPEGFRSILASSSKTVRRWQFMPWFRWLMGGHVGLLKLLGVVALFGSVAILSGVYSLRALQPTLLHASIDRGVLDCPTMAGDRKENVTCNALTRATFGADSRFHDGCYLNVMRLVLPAQHLASGVENVSSQWPAPPSDASLVCQEANGFDMKAVLDNATNLDRLTAGIRSSPMPAEVSADATFARRTVVLSVPPTPPTDTDKGRPVTVVDIAWISAAPGPEGIALGGVVSQDPKSATSPDTPLPTFPFSFVVSDNLASNPQSLVVKSGLCVDIGARLNIVAIGQGEDPAKQLASIVGDGPGKDLAFLRFALDGAAGRSSLDVDLVDTPLFMPITAAEANRTAPPANRADLLKIYPDVDPLLKKKPPLGFDRARLVGTCP